MMTSPRLLEPADPCPCGSGRTFAACCLGEGQAFYLDGKNIPVLIRTDVAVPLPDDVEPHINLIRSLESQDHRVRLLHNTVYLQPKNETFHEFLIALTQRTLGVDWWKHQIRTPLVDRHVVVKWKFAWAELTQRAGTTPKRSEDGRAFVAEASGPAWALLMLGYDLYCLQAVHRLPEFLIEKLRTNRTFQSARYEVAVAAIMARANFDIAFLDDKDKTNKHCEFIARHGATQFEVAVEAKSRRRPGSLHEKGIFAYDGDWKGVANLMRTAKRQRPQNLPFIIFVDLNLPFSPGVPTSEKPWVADMEAALAKVFGHPSPERPRPFSVLVPTNFAHYYGLADASPGQGEWSMIVPLYPEVIIPDDRLLHDLLNSLERYDRVPVDV